MATEKTTTVVATRLTLAEADAVYKQAREQKTTAACLIRQALEKTGIIPIVLKTSDRS